MKVVLAMVCCVILGPLLVGAASSDVERDRYLVKIGGCNDCHTAGYSASGGSIPEAQWLKGVPIGFKGPWGVTYPANLRLLIQAMSEDEWTRRAGQPLRPPMPWFALREMTESDRRAMYRYIRSLGSAGTPAPAYVPPGQSAATPYVVFVPQWEERRTAERK
jgi:mono/diheme cytochrome c family protein